MMDLLGIPDILEAKNVLVVQPHYDDNDIGCGGTIARLASLGAKITYVTVTDDQVGVRDVSLSREQAALQMDAEQVKAGEIIGVSEQVNFNFPDAGRYDHYDLRDKVVREIRRVRPDFVVTCDPWLSYEAHRDHILCGQAVAEAATLYSLLRLKVDPEIDDNYQPHDVVGVAFYYTSAPNTYVSIDGFTEQKRKAVACYETQIGPEDAQMMAMYLEFKEQGWAQDQDCNNAEALKVLRPLHLHANPDAPTM